MIASDAFGEIDGKRVTRFRLASEAGVVVELLTYGVTVSDWRVPVAGGVRPVVLGFDTLEAYRRQNAFVGSIQGRVANRIAGARFSLEGAAYRLAANEGRHILHGGAEGLGRQNWSAEPDSAANAVRFSHVSPHGAMGFPGEVAFSATYRLEGHTLHLDLAGVPDRPTPINLCQHHYFNLGPGPDIAGHTLAIDAEGYTETGPGMIPTGRILPIEGTRNDFRRPRRLDTPLAHDLNFALRTGRDVGLPAASLAGPDGLVLSLVTDRPGLQFYAGQGLALDLPGGAFGANAGLCLEDQGFPDAPNHANFPSIIASPEQPYAHRCAITVK